MHSKNLKRDQTSLNKSRCELASKSYLDTNDWNTLKGAAKPKNQELKELNSYVEEVRSKLVIHYQRLELKGAEVTAVVYSLTNFGQTLIPTLDAILAWGNQIAEQKGAFVNLSGLKH